MNILGRSVLLTIMGLDGNSGVKHGNKVDRNGKMKHTHTHTCVFSTHWQYIHVQCQHSNYCAKYTCRCISYFQFSQPCLVSRVSFFRHKVVRCIITWLPSCTCNKLSNLPRPSPWSCGRGGGGGDIPYVKCELKPNQWVQTTHEIVQFERATGAVGCLPTSGFEGAVSS